MKDVIKDEIIVLYKEFRKWANSMQDAPSNIIDSWELEDDLPAFMNWLDIHY